MGFHPPSLSLSVASVDGVVVDGIRWVPCINRTWRCNWLVEADVRADLALESVSPEPVSAGSATEADPNHELPIPPVDPRACFSCRLIRRRPAPDDLVAMRKLADTGEAQRRMLVQLMRLGLPIEAFHERPGGLGFDLLSSKSLGRPVTIGHANGIITLDLAESLDDHRESLRVTLGEAYRTVLGHYRHEIRHYYQWVLVEQGPLLADCRELFGDERVSYADAIQRHYTQGAPNDWRTSFISEYATMHPWEDFAETWAHYLHITDTLDSIGRSGMVLYADRVDGLVEHDIVPRTSYADASIDELLADWHWVSLLLNRANQAMGKGDLYPFTIVEPVARKLGFVHKVVRQSGSPRDVF